jgi:hypothetical protein
MVTRVHQLDSGEKNQKNIPDSSPHLGMQEAEKSCD